MNTDLTDRKKPHPCAVWSVVSEICAERRYCLASGQFITDGALPRQYLSVFIRVHLWRMLSPCLRVLCGSCREICAERR